MKNINNNGILNGTLKTDPVFVNNKDGSKKALITIVTTEQVVTENGQVLTVTRNLPMQGFIPRSYRGLGPYGFLKTGERIETEYAIKSNMYNNQLNIILQIDSIKFGKNLSTTKKAEKDSNVTHTENKHVNSYIDDIKSAEEEAKRQAIIEQCKIKERNMVVQSIPSNGLEEFNKFEDFE